MKLNEMVKNRLPNYEGIRNLDDSSGRFWKLNPLFMKKNNEKIMVEDKNNSTRLF